MNTYFEYWGKARKREDGGWDCHLLPYHCLDVAAVGVVWLEQDDALRARIACSVGIDKNDQQLNDVIGFFLAVHDIGKFDIRFQSKVPELRNLVWPELNQNDLLLNSNHSIYFDHGKTGYDIFVKFYAQFLSLKSQDEDLLDKWKPWIAAVTGHHGVIPNQAGWHNPMVEKCVIDHDQQARIEWFKALRSIFLNHDQSIFSIPEVSQDRGAFIAGFCSVADWIASNDLFVQWFGNEMPLERYFEEAKEHCRKIDILKKIGIVGRHPFSYAGITSLLSNNKPRQIQTLIDDMLPETGLSIIESPTGSGKTEAALALAWKLIDSGHADSIVFALPTQATADAMLERLQKIAPIIFEGADANLVLAHGKAKYNIIFANLKAASRPGAAQKGDQGAVQCAEWISSSRKRVFLGQIGICTIDQVLLSVLPVRHNFVRSFGVMKSVLIIDEVHAYDRYMYGLMEEVLKRQKSAGGCAILLSATLPAVQKRELFEAWHEGSSVIITDNDPYPLISKISSSGKSAPLITVTFDEMPPERVVHLELAISNNMQPDEAIITRLIDAAKSGALVAVVCNIVNDAQKIARRLRSIALDSSVQVDIFHARYRFKDRQEKEKTAKEMFGASDKRSSSRILVATQVVEQSLDLDFDWLVTQLCPVDLLFQRMGRLHRHNRLRPAGFEKPICTVLTSENDDFGVHEKYIYRDTRVLWRTRELLVKQCGEIHFPAAYRELIEAVYGKAIWDDEPNLVIGKSFAFRQEQNNMWHNAKMLTNNGMNPFADTDQNAASLTRGSEMGLTVVPIVAECGKKKILLDGERLVDVNEFQRDELLNMNSLSVPAGWKQWLPSFEEGYIYLPMENAGEGWVWKHGNTSLKYTKDFGLELWKEEEE